MSRRSKFARGEPHTPRVQQAYIPPNLTYDQMSELGRALFDLSREFEATGGTLLSEDEIERELTRRRGGAVVDDDH
jgi:hypothetical protein